MDLEKLREACPDLQGPYSRNAVLEALANSACKSGVYVIMPPDLVWVYIGSSSSIPRRVAQHLYLLRHQKHDKYEMQEDFTNSVDFVYYYQSCDDREKAYALEQQLLDLFADHPGLLNVATDAKFPWIRGEEYVHPLTGLQRPEAFKKKLSETVKTQFANGRIAPMKGRQHTPEFKRLISERMTGKVASEETKQKLSSQRQLGKHARAKAVIINGVEYDCVKSASLALGILYSTVYYRVSSDSPEFVCWYFKSI